MCFYEVRLIYIFTKKHCFCATENIQNGAVGEIGSSFNDYVNLAMEKAAVKVEA